jgi:cellulose biosynthesis protein BcsQ
VVLVADGDDQGSATVALGDGRRWRDGRDREDLVFVHVQAEAVNKPPKIRVPQVPGPAVNPPFDFMSKSGLQLPEFLKPVPEPGVSVTPSTTRSMD